MTDTVVIALVAGVPAIITAVGTLITIIFQVRHGAELKEIHKTTNSMKTELVEATRKNSEAVGRLAGINEEKARIVAEADVKDAGIVQGALEEKERRDAKSTVVVEVSAAEKAKQEARDAVEKAAVVAAAAVVAGPDLQADDLAKEIAKQVTVAVTQELARRAKGKS